MTYPSGREAEYTYDDRQLLKTIKWETAQVEDRSYNDAGMLTGVDRAFVDETRTYNAGSQLTQINNTNVGSQTYTYDLNGNVTSETLSGVIANYSFSMIVERAPRSLPGQKHALPISQFTNRNQTISCIKCFGALKARLHSGSDRGARSTISAEDRFMRFKRSGVTEDILLTRSNIGNISNVNRNGTNTARGYNTAHGLTTVTGGTTQTYDTDGNTTKLHTNVTAVWDDAGRMRNTNVPAGATAGIQGLNENGYVGGNRIWKKITRKAGVEHRVHIHAGPNLIAEYNSGVAASTPVQEYVYAGEIDSLVMIRRSDATRYGVTRNRQWSITALHDLANGTIVERYAYEITGRRTIYAANGTTIRTTSTYGNNFGYTNRWHDEDSGLMYFRARYYNPLTGEFLSRDPMEFVDGMSLYRGYFAVNAHDPFGLDVVTNWREVDQQVDSNDGLPLPKVPTPSPTVNPSSQAKNGPLECLIEVDGLPTGTSSKHFTWYGWNGVVRGRVEIGKGLDFVRVVSSAESIAEYPHWFGDGKDRVEAGARAIGQATCVYSPIRKRCVLHGSGSSDGPSSKQATRRLSVLDLSAYAIVKFHKAGPFSSSGEFNAHFAAAYGIKFKANGNANVNGKGGGVGIDWEYVDSQSDSVSGDTTVYVECHCMVID